MQILLIKQFMGPEIIKAICWTLVHSLWQGLLLSIAAGLVVITTKKRHAALRYNLLSILFLLFLLTSVYTFFVQSNQSYLQVPVASGVIIETAQPVITTHTSNINHSSLLNNLSDRFIYYFDKYAAIIVFGWFIVLITRLSKMSSGLIYINHIRSQQVSNPVSYWKNRTRELQRILRINKSIELLESGIIKVPMAIGWLKPAILIPAGFLANLSMDQIEAILLHELAHIKRRDYFVNLLQSLAETVFFFNPAVLWISSLIREERENCCDDIAIAVTKSKSKFINALVSFQEYNSTEYAMQFPGRKNQLLNRVKRIVYNSNNSLNNIEKAAIILCCVITVLVSAFIIPSSVTKSLPGEAQHIKTTLVAFKPVLKTSTNKFSQVVNKNFKLIKETASASKKPATLKKNIVKSASISPIAYKVDHKSQPQQYDTIPVTKMQVSLKNIKLDMGINYSLTTSITLTTELKLDTLKLDTLGKLDRLNPLEYPVFKSPRLSPGLRHNYNIDSTYHKQPDESASSHKIKRHNPEPRYNPVADPVIVELIKAKIITESIIQNKENFSYVLNNEALIVQGIKQAEELYQRLRAKYINPTGQTTCSYVWRN